jgi:FkbM family methyltransferase
MSQTTMIELTAPFLSEAEQVEELLDLERTWPLVRIIQQHTYAPVHNIRTCVVVGSYKGKVMQWLLQENPPSLVVGFEPQKWANIVARDRLAQYTADRWRISEYGLWVGETELPLYNFGTDACTMVDGDLVEATAPFKSIEESLKAIGKPIDLLIMNIEGAEFDVLPVILEDGPPINHLAVQFHEAHADMSALHHVLYMLDGYYTYNHPHALNSWGYWWQ